MTAHVGLGIFTAQVPPGAGFGMADELNAIIDLACAAEASAFDSVWMSEHHFAHDGYLPSVLPVLAAIASRTERVAVGSAAVLAPFHRPLRLAEDAAVVDNLSRGRLQLGLAAGWRAAEFDGFGIPMPERWARLGECVAVLREAWAPGRARFAGRFFQVDGVDVQPKPAHPIPIWIGGSADAAVLRAARIADGYVASSAPLEAVARRFALAASAVRDRPIELAVMLDVALDDAALPAYRYKQSVYRRWRELGDVSTGWPPSDESPDPLLITGSPAAVAARLAAYAMAAGDHDVTLIVRLHFPGMRLESSLASVRRFASDVLPRLREEVV